MLRGADCAQQGGLYHGDGTQCASGSCDCLALPYCFGDGSGTPCPCGNHDPAGAGGCANSSGFGGRLAALGSTSLSADDLQLEATHLIPNQPGLLFAGTQPVNGGSGIHFGDGLRCAGGQVRRLGVRTPDAQGRAVWGPGLGLAGGWTPGTLRFAQVWYRNPAGGPCLSGFNLTNGISIAVCP